MKASFVKAAVRERCICSIPHNEVQFYLSTREISVCWEHMKAHMMKPERVMWLDVIVTDKGFIFRDIETGTDVLLDSDYVARLKYSYIQHLAKTTPKPVTADIPVTGTGGK